MERRTLLRSGGVLGLSALAGCTDRLQGSRRQIECGELLFDELSSSDETGFRSADHHHDAYVLEAEAGMGLDVLVEPWYDVQDDRPTDTPYVYLLDPDDEVVAEAGQSGMWFATVRHQVEQSGDYTILVSSYDAGVTFDYGIWLRSCDKAVDALGCDDYILGALTETDETGLRSDEHYQDTYSLSLSANTRLTTIVDVDSADPAPFLYLLNDGGEVIAEASHPFEGRAAIISEIPADGTYTAVVTSVDPGAVFDYRVRAHCDPW